MTAHESAADLCRVYRSLNPAVVVAVAQELTDRASGAVDTQHVHRVLSELAASSREDTSVPWLDATRHLVRPPGAQGLPGAARGATDPPELTAPARPSSTPNPAPHASMGWEGRAEGPLSDAAQGADVGPDSTPQQAAPDVAALQQRFSTLDPSVVQDVCRGVESHAQAAAQLQAITGSPRRSPQVRPVESLPRGRCACDASAAWD